MRSCVMVMQCFAENSFVLVSDRYIMRSSLVLCRNATKMLAVSTESWAVAHRIMHTAVTVIGRLSESPLAI